MATTHDIPGGQVTFAEPTELTERRRRPAKSIAASLGVRLEQIMNARVVKTPTGEPLTPEEAAARTSENVDALELTQDEFEKVWALQDATTWGLLLSWTLDLPLPATPSDLLDLPSEVYDAMSVLAAQLEAGVITGGGFDVASVEDEASPTGASAD